MANFNSVKINMKSGAALTLVKKVMQARLKKCGHKLRAWIVRELRRYSTRKYGPSLPGEIPHVDTGTLSGRHIFWRFDGEDELCIVVGTNVQYGVWLETGTYYMAPRPYIRPALAANLPTIQKILTAKIRPSQSSES